MIANNKKLRYVRGVMRHKSITFRCAAPQLERMVHVLHENGLNRSCCLSDALIHFLSYVTTHEVSQLDLFGLVDKVDGMGGPHFSEQA